jgi:hypothetical protein
VNHSITSDGPVRDYEKLWRGIVGHAGPEGIAIQRQSTGTNMWLFDLWLAEHLLDEI